MELEDLVPPMKLCKQIPEGKFDESALVWEKHDEDQNVYEICPRLCCFCNIRNEKISPAPTLQEIMKKLYSESEGCCQLVNSFFDRNGWEIVAVYEDHDDSGYGGDYSNAKDRDNPATAALRLWLAVTSEKSDKSVKSEENP